MKKFLDSAGKFLTGLFGVLITILGFLFIFRKNGADILNNDDKLADEESRIDDKIDKLKEIEPGDLSDSEIERYWDE